MSVKKILINGQWVEGEERVVDVRSPYNGELVAEVCIYIRFRLVSLCRPGRWCC